MTIADKRSRRSKLNEPLIERLASIIAAGNYACVAFNSCGVPERTYYQWLEFADRDEKLGKESIFTQLSQAIKRAESEAEMIAVERFMSEVKAPGSFVAPATYYWHFHY